MFSKVMALGVATFLALPLLAQATGPQGLAEPYIPPVKAVADPSAPPVDPANIITIEWARGGTGSVLRRPDKAPRSGERLKILTNRGFYNGLTFHRVIDGFMAQGGDPKGDGSSGSDLPDLKAEFNDLPHLRGAMAMARTEQPNTANSQFYLMLSPNLTLDHRYTVVGRVIAGMGNVDRIEKGEPPLNPTRMTRVYFGAPPADPSLPTATATLPSRVAAPSVLPSGPISAPLATPARKRPGKQ